MQKIANLISEIETTEKQCLRKFGALPNWEPPSLTYIDEFHAKYDSCKTTHPDYYRENEEEALRQQIWILKSQLRIAKEILNSAHNK